LATKQLRLDVAQLTDVGRKREHNEDNMAYVIPKDQQIMAKKGALFIVADGMGGHAAGEVASEIAVDTVSNVYYQDDSDDVAISLLHAIKRANALIHQRASENMLRSGMGTTCVAAVLRGNMAYIANVGDSRAYLLRQSQVKQVSQDHSWVAEQVRAGLLTEDQARTHAQRNVITRCLGTQADVEIDVFPEAIEESDALVLCTDGLSGLVSDDEIRRIVDQTAPQESVYHLVERANENGGPDNITAIVVSVQEVGLEPPGVRRPVPVGGRETGEDTALLGLPPGSPAPLTSGFGDTRTPSNPLRYPSGPLLSPDNIVTAPQPVLQVPQRGRSRLFYPTLAILTLLILAAVGGGGYFYLKTTTGVNVAQNLQQAQSSLAKANSDVATNPTTALHELANAQTTLRALQQNTSLTNDQHQKVLNLLQGDFTRDVQEAIASYNQQAGITVLCSSNTTSNTVNQGTVGTQAKMIAQVSGKGKGNGTSLLYALGLDNKVYQVNNNTSLIQVPLPSTANTKVLDIASNGTQLIFLLSQPTNATDARAGNLYSVALFSPDQANPQQPHFDAMAQIDATFVKNGQVPKLITASGSDVYVVFGSDSTQTTTPIVDYFPKAGKPLAQTTSGSFSFSDTLVSLAAFPNHELFVLLAGGAVQSLQFASDNQPATSVFVQSAIAPPLPVSSKAFIWQTPVPVITSGETKSLAAPGATSPGTLAVGLVNGVPHLYIMDAAQHRILDLKVVSGGSAATPSASITPTSTSVGGQAVGSASPVTFQLQTQYASPSLLAQPKSMAVDDLGTQINVLTQNTPSMLALLSFNTGTVNNCG